MSARLPRLALSSGAAALALVLALPSAALADDDHGDSGDHGKGAAADTSAEDGHNPPGNNGTIKIDYPAPADSGHANRPHPGCAFQLRMFGFDDDQYGTVTFTGQAPTALGTLLTQTHVLLSDDAAGGGQDVDAVYSYTADQLGLTGKPQAKQGWHVKVSVDADDAPGGAKHKVFWLSCPATTSTAGAAGAAATGTQSTTQSTVTTKSIETATTGGSASAVTTAGALASTARATTAGLARVAAAGRASTAVTGGAATAALGTTRPAASRGSALPFTGFGLAGVLALAVATLLAGGLAVVAGRRRTAPVSPTR